jgi:signal transduction histidine kinase/DNA-binding response OmpR family regulator
VIAGREDSGGDAQPGLGRIAGDATAVGFAARLLDAIRDGVVISDRGGRVVFRNERATEIASAAAAGWSPCDPRFEAIHADGRMLADDERPSVVALRTGRPVVMTLGVPGSNRTVWIAVSSTPLHRRDEDRAYGVVTVFSDITERVEAERALVDARDAALRASAAKSEFLATMSHEIRTPLNGVIGSLDLMLDSDLPTELAELAAIARTAATDLSSIVDDILDLSKIEADKVERENVVFDLLPSVEGVADVAAIAARAKGIAVASFVDPQLPPAVVGDSRLVRQVLHNLAGNAVKFTDHGEVMLRAERMPAPVSQAVVRFSVSDTGPGIPPRAITTLFEPFTQVGASSTGPRAGSGLGLAIASRLVRLMGGELSVESELGRGSTFVFALPFALPDEQVEEPPPSGVRPLRVLVIEPSDTAAEIVERYVRAWGMVPTRVAERSLARERLATQAAERFDAAIVAVGSFDDDDATRLAGELRANGGEAGIVVIALLGLGERLAAPGGALPGFDAVVGTPVKRARLHEALAVIGATRGAAATPEADAPAGGLSGLRVLIAEDNLVNQQVLVRQAQRLGIIVDAVENGEQVLDALEQRRYDAVLMDCQMPVMDGYAATRAIREHEHEQGARMPIVAVTANAMREDFERCREAGMDDFVAKPVTLAALANAIERAVAASRRGLPAETASAPAGAVDMAALAALRDDVGGAGALARIVRLFLEQLDPQAEQIEEAARGGDHAALARTAHRMRSSAATLGATAMAESLSDLEDAARDGDAAACDRLAAAFAAQVASTRARFEELLAELDAGVVNGD